METYTILVLLVGVLTVAGIFARAGLDQLGLPTLLAFLAMGFLVRLGEPHLASLVHLSTGA